MHVTSTGEGVPQRRVRNPSGATARPGKAAVLLRPCARGGSRTHTSLRTADFESAASAIPPLGPVGASMVPALVERVRGACGTHRARLRAVPDLQPPTAEPLSIYGSPTEVSPLDWTWVDEQLGGRGHLLGVANGSGHPHPRPAVGTVDRPSAAPQHRQPVDQSPDRRRRQRHRAPRERDGRRDRAGHGGWAPPRHPALIERYDAKYDWTYTIDEYGPLTTVDPVSVIAWRSAGWAGRESFKTAGKWRFD